MNSFVWIGIFQLKKKFAEVFPKQIFLALWFIGTDSVSTT